MYSNKNPTWLELYDELSEEAKREYEIGYEIWRDEINRKLLEVLSR